MKRLLLVCVFLVGAAQISAAASRVFEKADALYRPKRLVRGVGIKFGHAAIYLNSKSGYLFTAAEAQAHALPRIEASDGLHSVIQSPGYFQGGVQKATFADFLGSLSFWGAYTAPGGMTPEGRQRAIWQAGSHLTAGYTLFKRWKGPTDFRCDGLIVDAYSAALVSIPDAPGSGGAWWKNLPRLQRQQLQLETPSAPGCRPTTRTPNGSAFTLSMTSVKDAPFNGSGTDRVEFYNGAPDAGGTLIGTDDHDANPDAGLADSDSYSISSPIDPGASLFTRIFDQAGNSATCDVLGQVVGTSDLAQISPNIVEDVTAPTIGTIDIPPGNQTVTASWSGSDDQTPANQINYAYAVDVPFDQWDDPDVTILGAQTSATIDASSLAEGQHTLYLIAMDEEGNISTANQSFTVKSPLPPSITINTLSENLFNARRGTLTDIPTTLSLEAFVSIEDEIGIDTVTMPGTLSIGTVPVVVEN